MSALPSGTVTFLFTDIEGSTRLVQALGDGYPPVLAEQRRMIAEAIHSNDGVLFGSEGDALFAAFAGAASALRAAAAAQHALGAHVWRDGIELRVRMGIHTGDATLVGDDYVGLTLHEVARITSAGHGGQVLVSGDTHGLASNELAGNLQLVDLGEHRLKDLPRPMRLFQLAGDGLAHDFPALRTLDSRPNNLPVLMTSFVERGELVAAREALAGTRLLTLTGPGGTGKTRLALQLAADMLEGFIDGAFFVELESVTDPDLVPAVIGSTIGVSQAPNRTPLEALEDHLRDRRLLLVLDNFEQVVDAGPTLAHLLRDAPGLRIIVTSRVVLHVYGEHELPVPPLATSEGVRLFVDRARAVQPSFAIGDGNLAAVQEIVNRLDGLPLAIELAAARARVLPVEAIRARLDQRLALLTGGSRDLPARQQTLRGAIDWSYGLLEPPEQQLLERFSVFAGGAFLTEAEQVCGPAGEVGGDILDGLSALVDKSLLRAVVAGADEPRFAMLATIREYATERLVERGVLDGVRQRHGQAYSAVVERCAPLLTTGQGSAWHDRLEADHDNLRAALDWAVEGGRTEVVLGIVAGLWRFWQARGHLHEARRRVERALVMSGVEDQPAELLARAFGAAGGIAYWQGDFVAANGWYSKALEAAEATGDRAVIALAHYNQGFAALDHEAEQDARYQAARPWFERALEIYRELGHDQGIADAEWAMSLSAAADRDLDTASDHARRALDAYQRLDNPFGAGWAAHMLVLYRMADDQFDEALDYAAQALAIFERSHDVSGMILVAYDVALVLFRRDRRPEGLRIAGAVERLAREAGVGVLGGGFEYLSWREPEPPEDEPGLAYWNEGADWTVEQVVEYARQHLPAQTVEGSPGSIEARPNRAG
jgi:predicted ATPase/class 3 adenylate cyclase